jgi:hypothetical protein
MSRNGNTEKNTSPQKARRFSSFIASINEKKIVIIALLAVSAIFSLLFWSLYNQSYTASILIYPDQISKPGLMPEGSVPEASFGNEAYSIPLEAYPALLRSPEIQIEVLQKDYTVKFDYKSYSVDLTRYFALKNISYALRELNDITEITILDNSGILKLSVTTKYPDLSRQIAEAYMKELEKQLEQIRREKISENIDQIDQALQFIETNKSITDSARVDLISRLQSKKDIFLLAAELNPVKLGMVMEGYTHKKGVFSKTSCASIPLIVGFVTVLIILGLGMRKFQKKYADVAVTTGRVHLKRKPETAPVQSRGKPVRKTTPKTSTQKIPQRRRAVKV